MNVRKYAQRPEFALVAFLFIFSSVWAVPSNVLVNNPAADLGPNDTQAGTAITLGSGSNVVVMFNDSGSFSGSSNHFTGWSRSTDGGVSFTDLGKLPDSTFGDAGFPSLARDTLSGAIYACTLPLTVGNHILVFKSVDNGATFGLPVDATANAVTGSMDKPWITVDNFPGTGRGYIYVTWRNFGPANGIQMSRSVDGGLSFSPPVLVASGGSGNVQGAQPVVAPDHSVSVFYLHETVPKTLKVAKSTNLGLSFAPAVQVAVLTVTGLNGDLALGGFRSNCFPRPEVNPVSGHFYVVYPNKGTFPDRANIWFTKSTDGGASWAAPAQVNTDGTINDQWQPVIAVTPDGNNLFAGWYDRRRDPANSLIDVYGDTAAISGSTVTFRGNARISPQSFSAAFAQDPNVNTTFMGDYDSATADNAWFYYPWMDTRLPSGFHARQPDVRMSKISVLGIGAGVALEAVSLLGGNGDGALNPAECNDVYVSIHNDGDVALTNISATLESSTPGLTVSQPNGKFPNLATNASVTNSVAFRVSTSALYGCGLAGSATLNVFTNQGTFQLPIVFAAASTAGTSTRFDNNVAIPIPDTSTISSPITVSGFSGLLAQVEVHLHITHTFDSDLRLLLLSPDGTTVSLALNRGGSGHNFGSACSPDSSRTTFSDDAATSISSGTAPFVGTFKPEQPLANFNGKTAAQVNGTWNLIVQDTAALDIGTLQCWSLMVAPAVCINGPGACDPTYNQPGPFTGWVKSGIESGPESGVDPASIDDVDVSSNAGELSTIVRASTSRYRVLGWTHPNVLTMPGTNKHIRGKFHVYTSNPGTDPINKVPAFRVRLQSEGAYVGAVTYNYGNTGHSGPDADGSVATPNIYGFLDNPNADTKAGQNLRPGNNPIKPSVYRVDFDPVDVPAEVGKKIVATFESFAFVNPAAGTLSLTQVNVSTYPEILDIQGVKIFTYRHNAFASSQGITLGFGGFNAENDLSPGYRQKLFAGTPFDSTPPSQLHTGSEQAALNTTGITVDTINCPVNTFGVSIVDITRSSLTLEPRVIPGKLYRARFYATSNIPTSSATAGGNRQGGVRFRVQTGLGTVNCYQDFNGAWGASDISINKQIGVQALPGVGSQNPDTDPSLTPAGQDGGWYTVLMPTPLDPDIRADTDGSVAVKMPQFNSEPGPGTNVASAKKIVLGVDLIRQPTTLTVGPGAFSNLPFAQTNQAKVSITAIDLYELPPRGD